MADAGFPALGFDPSPGMPTEVQQLTSSLSTAVSKLQTAHDLLKQVATAQGIWEGEAADNFKKTVGEMPKHLGNAEESLRKAANLLKEWYDKLTGFDHTADKYEQEAKQAKQAINQAEQTYNTAKSNPDLDLKGQHFNTDAALQEAQQRHNTAVNQLEEAKKGLTTAQNNLDEIIRKAKKLLDSHDTEANATARQIKGKAADLAPPEPGFWESIGNALEWIWNHLGDIAAVVGAIAGIVAILCTGPIAAVVAIVAVVASAVAFSKHLARDWEKINQWPPDLQATLGLLGDAAGMIPGVGALKGGISMGGSAGKLLSSADEALSAGEKIASGVVQGVKYGTKQWGDEVVQAAQGAGKVMKGVTIGTASIAVPGGVAGMAASDNEPLGWANAGNAGATGGFGFGDAIIKGVGALGK